MGFYELQAPTAWADPPSIWSSTSIDDVEACPRRWQLLRSGWGDCERFPVRWHPAAIEGQIVHDSLDRLTRACGQRGNPPFGSPEFAAALTDSDFFPGFARALAEWDQCLMSHPRRGPPYRLRASGEDLANRAVRMFREQYKPDGTAVPCAAERAAETPVNVKALLTKKHALSEVKLTHPDLPFIGILDRVQVAGEGVEVVDFKTGKPSDKHRDQLLRYAVLWWRVAGDVPVRVSAQYLNGAASWTPTVAQLRETERELAVKLPLLSEALRAHPAPAKAGVACRSCAVRARCDAGWIFTEETDGVDGRRDVQLTVTAPPGEHGFLARSRRGEEVAVVYQSGVATLLDSVVEGAVIRVLDGAWKRGGNELEIKVWTEVFLVDPRI